MTDSRSLFFDSPLGYIEIRGTPRGILEVRFVDDEGASDVPHPIMKDCQHQVEEYLVGRRTAFDSLPLILEGSDFMLSVWDEIAAIPFGETRAYQQIAKRVKRPAAVRAVGTACGKNRIVIIIPCHRVVPSSGGVGNYAGGDMRKEWLLEHERHMKR